MSVKRRSKRDVDRFVSQINEKERVTRGYQIALLYHEVGEQAEAKRYLTQYMSKRDDMHQAHKLMAQILEAQGDKDQALKSYKRCLELDPKQKNLLLKICELYTSSRGVNPETLRYWADRTKAVHPCSAVLLKLQEKILSESGGDGKLEEFYIGQLKKNSYDIPTHIKLLDVYLTTNRTRQAYRYSVEKVKDLAFLTDMQWNEYLLKIFHAYTKVERVSTDPDFHVNKLFTLCNLCVLKMKNGEIVDCVSTLHQFDQTLFGAMLIQNKLEEWTYFLSEMQGQYFFLLGVLLMKKAQKGQLPWKDASMFALICFLISNQFSRMETRSPWFAKLKPGVRDFYGRLESMGCYRLIQGGCVTLSLTEGENTSRMNSVRQLRTVQAREKLYEILFTLREMRDLKSQSYLLRSESFMKSALIPPIRQTLAEYEPGVFQLCHDNLHELVWVAMNRAAPKDGVHKSFPLHISDKLKYSTGDLKSGSPEALCVLDIHAFFYLTVSFSSHSYQDQVKNTRRDPYMPYLLPACLCKPLCLQPQSDWWTAAEKFLSNSAKDGFAKLRFTLQKGIETARLIGAHGVSPLNVLMLARTFDERVKDMKAVEFDGNSHCTKLEAQERWAAHYWREAMDLLSKIERNVRIPCPKERIFPDNQNVDLDPKQVPGLIEQAKFSLATVAMREGRYEEAKEMFETLKSPWAAFYISQIYRTLADQIDPDTEDGNDQRIALVERSLDMLYQTSERIQANKNHELHRVIPTDIDECVNYLDTLRASASGVSLVESVLYQDAREGSEKDSGEESFGTPTARPPREPLSCQEESVSLPEPPNFSTPAAALRPSSYSVTQRSGGRSRPSPERLDARIWVLETKLQTALDTIQEMKEKMKEVVETQNKYRADQIENQDMIRQLKEQLSLYNRQNAQYLPPPPISSVYRPHPAQYNLPQPLTSPWAGSSLGYNTPSSPAAGGGPTRRGMGRAGQMSLTSDIEDEFYQFGEDCYEDDGSQPHPGMYGEMHSHHGLYGVPDSQLEQNWPFGHKAGLEGKSTITYAPPIPGGQSQSRMPQPGFFTNALRGHTLQYAYSQASTEGQQTAGQPSSVGQALQGQNLFISQGSTSQTPGSHSPMLAQALAAKSPAIASSPIMPPNAVAGQQMSAKPSLIQGTSGTSQAVSSGTSVFGSASSASSLPLFGSLVAASKSPDKPICQTSAPSNSTTVSLATPGGFAALASGSTPTFGSLASASNSGYTPTFGSLGAASSAGSTPTFGSLSVASSSGSTPALGSAALSTPSFSSLAAGSKATPSFGTPGSTTGSDGTSQTTSSPFTGFAGFGTKSQTEKSEPLFQGFALGGSSKPLFSPAKPTSPSPQKPVISQTSTPGQSPRKRNDSMEEFEPNVDFKPVLEKLPDLIELKSGEEEEERLFCERAKLFRFDKETKQWKERGIGEMKILKHKENGQVRILMRREQVLKLCANHRLSKEMKLTSMSGSDKAWCWVANDFSEEELKLEQLAVKFKSTELAQKFKEVFEDAQKSMEEADTSPEKPAQVSDTKGKAESQSQPKQSLAEMFKPKSGQWECSGCLLRVDGDKLKCLACGTLKPGVKPEDVQDQTVSKLNTGTGGGFKFNTSSGGGSSGPSFGSSQGGFTFGRPTAEASTGSTPSGFTFAPQTTAQSTSGSTPSGFTFGNKSTAGSTPGKFSFGNTTATASSGSSANQASTGGFKFGTPSMTSTTTTQSNTGSTPTGGFRFGNVPSTTTTATTQSSSGSTPAGSFSFGTPASTTTTATTQSSSGSIPAGSFSFGTPASTTTTATTQSSSGSTPAGSFSFGTPASITTTATTQSSSGSTPAGSFSFGTPASTTTAATTLSSSGSTPAGGFSFGNVPSTSSTTTTPSVFGSSKSTGFSFGTTPTTSSTDTKPAQAFSFKTTTQPSSTTTTTTNKPFSGFSFGSTTSTSESAPFSFTKGEKPLVKAEADSTDEGKSTSQLAELLKSEDTKSHAVAKPDSAEAGTKPKFGLEKFSFTPSSGGFSFGTPKGKEEKTEGAPFQFTPASSAKSPEMVRSPEIDKDGMYVNKEGEDAHIYFEPVIELPDKVDVKTGEEDENVLFQHRAKLFRFHNKEWKERGLGDIKILEHKETKKVRIVMRREQVLKLCCNHYLTPNMELKPMPKAEGKAWLWVAIDFSEGEANPEQLSVRFKTAEIANKFKEAFDAAKEGIQADTSTLEQNSQVSSTSAAIGDSRTDNQDVVFIREERATEEQIARARKYQLPDNFYLYETKPECSGCIGCEDYEPRKKVTPKKASEKPSTSDGSLPSQSTTPLFGNKPTTASRLFGSSAPSPSGGLIGSSAPSPSGGLFGSSAPSPSGGLFGTSTSSGGLFGSGSSSGTSSGGLFGASAPSGGGDSASSSVFGSTTGGLFGTTASEGFSFSSLAAKSDTSPSGFKKDDSRPFSWSGAGQQLFGTPREGEEDEDDDGEQEYDPQFEPIIELPELVEVKSGEEDFDKVFCHRAKLFRFDKDTNQWKEKGIGEMKILKQKETGKYRILLRREQVLKLACNHWLTSDMDFQPLKTSETSWCWVAQDFSSEEPKIEQFAVRFKTAELAKDFMDKIHECQQDLRERQTGQEVTSSQNTYKEAPKSSEEKKTEPASTPAAKPSHSTVDTKPVQQTTVTKPVQEVRQTTPGLQVTQTKTAQFREEGKPEQRVPEVHQDDDEEDDDEEEDEEDYEDVEEVLMEKRVTLFSREDDWKVVGLGTLRVIYDDDVNGNKVYVETDKKEIVCNHLIARESSLILNKKRKYCEWSPIDFSTDEPVRRHFRAQFSSEVSLVEFEKFFNQGKSLAVDSDISESDMMVAREITIPDVYGQAADED